MPHPLFVGVDIALKNNWVCLLDCLGQEVGRRFSVPNDRVGTQRLAERLAQVMRQGEYDSLRLAVEATGWYWFHLLQSLGSQPALNAWPLELYALNPLLPAKYRQALGERDKSDDKDALNISERLRVPRGLPPPYELQPVHLALRFLTRYRFHLVQDLVREKNYCANLIYLKASQYRPKQPFADVYGATSQAVLQEFISCEEIVSTPVEELAAFLDEQGCGRFADAEQTARELQAVASASYSLPAALQPSVNLALGWGLEHIRFLQEQEQAIAVAIGEQVAQLPNTLQTIPGIGPVFSAGLIAEIGDLGRYGYSEAKVAKAAGLSWSQNQSGEFEAEDSHLDRFGNRYLRYYFCEAANAVRMHDAEYGAFYERKYKEVRKHQHKRAVTLTARKLVRLVVRLLTTNQPYRPRSAAPS
jgi:transposase